MTIALRFIALHIIPGRVLFFTRPGQAFLRLYYRYWCPGGNERVRDCIAAGTCGCDNGQSTITEKS